MKDGDLERRDPFLDAEECPLEPVRLPADLARLAGTSDGASDERMQIALSKIDANKVPDDVRRRLIEAMTRVEVAALALGGARDDVGFSAAACGQFEDTLKELARVFQARHDSSAEELSQVVRCWWNTADARRRLAILDSEMTKLSLRRSAIDSADPGDARGRAIDLLRDKYVLLRVAFAKIQPASDEYASAWRDLALLLDQVAARSGVQRADRRQLTVMLTAIPQMELVTRQLDEGIHQLRRIEELKSYTGAWGMCWNLALSYSPAEATEAAAVARGASDRLAELKAAWEGRKTLVLTALDKVLSVDGME